MAFTYDPSDGFSDAERVRFHIADTVEAEAKFSDEEITAIITEEGTWQKAVIACLYNLRARVMDPNFRADWLQVDNKSAADSLKDLIREKQRELGVTRYTSGVKRVFRADGRQKETPDYIND